MPQIPVTAWGGHTEARSQELYLGLPHGWQEPKYLSHHLPPRVHSSRKLVSERSWDVSPGPPAGMQASQVQCWSLRHAPAPYHLKYVVIFGGYLETILHLLFGCGLALCEEVITSSDVTDISTLAKAEKLKTEST